MTRRYLVAAGLIAALAGGSAVAIADQPQGRGMRGPGPRGAAPMLDMGLRGVELTDAQREQVRSIMESHKSEFDAVRTKVRDAHRAFADAVRATPVDEAAVRAASAAIGTAMADEALLNARVRTEVHGLLTPEQQAQLTQRRAEMEKRMQEREGRLKERRPGRR